MTWKEQFDRSRLDSTQVLVLFPEMTWLADIVESFNDALHEGSRMANIDYAWQKLSQARVFKLLRQQISLRNSCPHSTK